MLRCHEVGGRFAGQWGVGRQSKRRFRPKGRLGQNISKTVVIFTQGPDVDCQ